MISLLICSSNVMGKEIKRDPDTGMIRVLYIGTPFQAFSPYPFFRIDPLLSTTPISGLAWLEPEIVVRALRLYLPRTRNDYTKYDVIGLDDASFEHFPPNTLVWMRDTVLDDGLGFFMGGGSGSFGGAHGYPSYADTPLQDIMPVYCLPENNGFSINTVIEFDDEFIKSIPWEEYKNHNVFGFYNVVVLRDGAVKLSELRAMTGGGADPGWTWWDIGEGRFFASPTGFRGSVGAGTTSAGVSFIYWKHYPDFVSNMVYFLAGLTPPSDTQLLYTTRLRFREVDYHRQMIVGTMEFISRFGASSNRVDEKLAEAEDVLSRARGFFVDLDLANSLEEADQAILLLREADELALRAKQTALFWVYAIEWLAVTATLLLCGVVLWSLMVRRRLYREVSATRMKPM
ncbi:MAG: hypothetical protein HXS50_05305 [Theionarchaea archaeon]|nr:hypothetical protein [Theionarchaea archaeon]